MSIKQTNLNHNDFEPKRFGLRYNPPQIVMEYLVPSKKKLYHHKIRLQKLKYDSNIEEIIREIYEKHNKYLEPSKVPQKQIVNLVEKLRSNLKNAKSLLNAEKENNNNYNFNAGNANTNMNKDFTPLNPSFNNNIKSYSTLSNKSITGNNIVSNGNNNDKNSIDNNFDNIKTSLHNKISQNLNQNNKNFENEEEKESKMVNDLKKEDDLSNIYTSNHKFVNYGFNDTEENEKKYSDLTEQSNKLLVETNTDKSLNLFNNTSSSATFNKSFKDEMFNNSKNSKSIKTNNEKSNINDDDEDDYGFDDYDEDEDDFYNKLDDKMDLNQFKKNIIDKYKSHMEKDFEKNAIKPGDENYQYDKRMEFEPRKVDPTWDDFDEISEEL